MTRSPNPMHAYLRWTDASKAPETLCGEHLGRKRRLQVPLAIHAIRTDLNPCATCLAEAERIVRETDQERAAMLVRKWTTA